MTKAALTRLFSPKTVAVVGGRVAESVVTEMDKLGFTGKIWPVNPNRAEIAGRPCFSSITDLPSAPDAAYVAVPRDAAIEAIAQLAGAGAGGAICHASGFSELGTDGAEYTSQLITAAREMPVLGPNCWGVLNLLDRTALWPDFHGAEPVARGVAIINQSGNMAINYTMQRRGLPLGAIVTLGNQAIVDANDCLEAFLADDRITAIGLHIEGMADVARFSRLAIQARDASKPIVVLKTGASAKGACATVSHTATLAGPDKLYDALFSRYGIARAHSVPAFLETLKLLSVTGPLGGNRIASLNCSGGEASLIADRCEHRDLRLPDLTAEHAATIRATLNDYVDVTNPLDYHTFIWGKMDEMTAAFAAMMQGGFDLTALTLDYPRQDRSRHEEYDLALDAWIDAKNQTGATTAVIATLPECLPESVALKLMANDVVPFAGMEEALDAIEAAAGIVKAIKAAPLTASTLPPVNPVTLKEAIAKQRLADFGLHIPRGVDCAIEDTAEEANNLSFPLVVKASCADLAHKSEAGAVRLNLNTTNEAIQAAEIMRDLSPTILIEEMVTDGVVELIVGINRDPQFGLHLVIGAGGVLVELLKDTATLLLPISHNDIRNALQSLTIWPLLNGYRGRPCGDIAATIDAIAVIASFTEAHAAALVELDVNPLIVRPQGHGAVAVDALISLGEQP